MAKGLLRLSLPKKTPTIIRVGRSMDSWLELALREFYVDKRPLWGVPRMVIKGWTPSSLGEPNDRLLISTLLGYRGEAISEKLQRIFDAGNDIEERWHKRFTDLGILKSKSIWIPKKPEHPVKFSGKIDAIITHKYEKNRDFLVEIKSISPEGFRALPSVSMSPETNFVQLLEVKNITGTRIRKYMQQLQVYLYTMNMEEGILLFDNKGNQDFHTYSILRNDDFIQGIFDRLIRLQEYWKEGILPPWNGGKSKELLGNYKPDEDVPVDEMRDQYHTKGVGYVGEF